MVAFKDSVGAFVPGARAECLPVAEGPLSGLTFAVKDLVRCPGRADHLRHPDWARTHPLAGATAPVILSLLHAGASLAGKTKTVELAYGLTGENVWHGTPRNPRAPERFPGGSSCGSAAAAAAGLVDFALGSEPAGRSAFRPAIAACSASARASARSAWPGPGASRPVWIPAAGSRQMPACFRG